MSERVDEVENEENSDGSEHEIDLPDDEVLLPYQFEPLAIGSDSNSSDDSSASECSEDDVATQNRLEDVKKWCRCNMCTLMATEEECVCCVDLTVPRRKIGMHGKWRVEIIDKKASILTLF